MGPWLQWNSTASAPQHFYRFESGRVHLDTNRDSAGGHGRKPTLNGDLAVANANSY